MNNETIIQLSSLLNEGRLLWRTIIYPEGGEMYCSEAQLLMHRIIEIETQIEILFSHLFIQQEELLQAQRNPRRRGRNWESPTLKSSRTSVSQIMMMIGIPSPVAEPSLKLYAKRITRETTAEVEPRTDMNALQYSIFPGHVSNEQRQKVQAAIAQSDSKHLALFRDHQCQYRGLYTWDQFSDTVHKIGLGPNGMTVMIDYDSGAKMFRRSPTNKFLSPQLTVSSSPNSTGISQNSAQLPLINANDVV